jgi:hypothetical protein
MGELHVDSRKQNRLPHPEIAIKSLKTKIKQRKNDAPLHAKIVFETAKTSRRSFACNGDKLVFAPINFSICSSVMPP